MSSSTGTTPGGGVWITGPSGIGKTTLAAALGGQDLDEFGYRSMLRSSSIQPKWKVSIDVLRFRMSEAHYTKEIPTYWLGTSDNMSEISKLDWRSIIVIWAKASVLRSHLEQRIKDQPLTAVLDRGKLAKIRDEDYPQIWKTKAQGLSRVHPTLFLDIESLQATDVAVAIKLWHDRKRPPSGLTEATLLPGGHIETPVPEGSQRQVAKHVETYDRFARF